VSVKLVLVNELPYRKRNKHDQTTGLGGGGPGSAGRRRFYAVGGRTGALLLYVKYVMRQEYGPSREVTWQQGPAVAAASQAGRPPNVVLIVADDLGFNDITYYGGVAGGKVPTPNIDSIARGGVAFRNGYSGNATCAPRGRP